MKSLKPLTKVILDNRREKSDGSFPVKLRITYNRNQRLYPLGLSFTQSEFDYIMSQQDVRGKHKKYKLQMMENEKKAIDIIDKMPVFTFQLFEKKFLQPKGQETNVFYWYEKVITQLEKQGRVGTASNYRCSLHSLQGFTNRPRIEFHEITSDFLSNYEKKMVDIGNSLTTVGMYLRPLRAIFNKALEDEVIVHDFYPFGKGKYVIPAVRNKKKALNSADLKKIIDYIPIENSTESWARDLWLFSFLCNGMNVNDIANLKYKNIDGNVIRFIRGKTINTSKQNLKSIEAIITPPVQKIIDRWGVKPSKPELYIFNLITDDLSPVKKKAKIQQATKQIIKYIRRIAKQLDIGMDVTTYTARHTYVTKMRNLNAPMDHISDNVGHADIKTTSLYVDSIETDWKHDLAERLYQ